MKDRIYLSSPHMGGMEMQYIEEAFATNWIAPLGKNVTEFENEMCAYTGRGYAAALSSGTAAIHLALKYFGVEKGDVVFCSSFTFSGSCNSILYQGATPVFIDSDTETYNMSASALEKAYLKYPNPKAIIIVNLYGNPANFEKLLKITRSHGTPVIEDSAESLGSKYQGKQTGNFGDVSIFSFNGNKIITTSGGGMAVMDDPQMREKFIFWATQSREKFAWYQHNDVGYNYRLSNVCAGIGRGQLKVLDNRVQRKREIYNLYKQEFESDSIVSKYIRMVPEPKDSECNHWLSAFTLSRDCKTTFLELICALEKKNIESRPAWKPMHVQPIFKDCDFFADGACEYNSKAYSEQILKIAAETGVNVNNSVCEDLFARSICLPSDTKMTDSDVKFTASIIKELIGAANK